MSGKDFEALVQRLKDEGWKKSGMSLTSEDFHLYKAYEEYYDKYDERHYRYQILISFWDWRRYGNNATGGYEENEVGIEIVVMPIDLVDYGRVDLHISKFDGITSLERIAKDYYEWVRKNFKCKERDDKEDLVRGKRKGTG